jgi:CubicO group peptidase (beta-lactamase class C family)
MRRSLHALALSLILAPIGPAVAQPTPAQSTPAQSTAVPAAVAKALPEIDRIFADFRLDSHSPGLIYGIVADGRLVHLKGLGVQDMERKRPVTADSLFRIASMTKSFTALAILKLRDEGKLSLDDLAEKYVPEMRGWTYPTQDAPRIRIRDLLTHQAGFVTDNPWGDRQQVLPQADFTAMLKSGVPFSRAANQAYEYSNFGYAVLGRIVANVSGMPYADYVQRTILTPLGMTASGFEATKAPVERHALGYRWEEGKWKPEPVMIDGAFNAMGGLQVSANDYARYVAFLLSAWPPRDGADAGPVKRGSVRMLATGSGLPNVVQRPGSTGAAACRQGFVYGFAMRIAQDCDLGLTVAHSGGYPGYGSFVLLMPESGVGIFAFSNRTYNSGTPPVWDAAMALHRAGAIAKRAIPISPLLAQGYAAVGRIYAAGDVMAAKDNLAMNFLMDKDAPAWAKALAAVKEQAGACATDAPIVPNGAMSGSFTWTCATGRVRGDVLLAPTANATIQELHFVATQ